MKTRLSPIYRTNCEHLSQKFVNFSRFCDNFRQVRFDETYMPSFRNLL